MKAFSSKVLRKEENGLIGGLENGIEGQIQEEDMEDEHVKGLKQEGQRLKFLNLNAVPPKYTKKLTRLGLRQIWFRLITDFLS